MLQCFLELCYRGWNMSKREKIILIELIVPPSIVILWLLLYFTILWRLPFTYNLNRVKIPDDCREIETNVIWTDLEIVHIKAERVFSSERSLEELKDYINKNNSRLGRIDFGWWSCPEYDHADAVSPDDHPELSWDGTETYYVLTYSTWGTSIDTFVFLAGSFIAGIIWILTSIPAGVLLRKKAFGVFPDSFADRSQSFTKKYAVASLGIGIVCLVPYVFLLTGLPDILDGLIYTLVELFVFVLWAGRPMAAVLLAGISAGGLFCGIKGDALEGRRTAVTGSVCSVFGICLAAGMFCRYFLVGI